MAKFKFGKFETEIDATDVDFMEKYETEVKKYTDSAVKISENPPETDSAGLKLLCGIFFTFFDAMFGEDARQKMFGEKRSLKLCFEAFGALSDCIKNDDSALKTANRFIGNRAQRRANQ